MRYRLHRARFGGWIGDEQIVCLDGASDEPLTEQHLIGVAEGVAQAGGALEVLTGGGLEHLALEAVDQVGTLPAKEGASVLDCLAIFFLCACRSCRPCTALGSA